MKTVIYTKYNQGRTPKFQTRTSMCQEDGVRYIEKRPLNEETGAHIRQFRENYERAGHLYPAIRLVEGTFEENCVRYPFVEGTGLEEALLRGLSSWEELFSRMRKIFSRLYVVNPQNRCAFEKTEGFSEMFGEADCGGMDCISPCNLDVIFDNLVLLSDGSVTAFDYEWVCDFPVPERYVLYRVLCHFYDKYLAEISARYTFAAFVSKFDFTDRELVLFREMEDAFIRYAYTGGEPAFTDARYQRIRTTFGELENHEQLAEEYRKTVIRYQDVVQVLHDTEKEYLLTIDRLNNAVRIKEEAEQLLHNTEKEYLATIDKLNEAVRIKDEMYAQLVHANEMLADMRRAYEETSAAWQQSREECESMRASLSWKVTKPLRRAGQALGRGKKQ